MLGQVPTAFSHLPVMIVFRNLFLFVFCVVLTACLSVVLLAPEFLLPMKCGLEVPMSLRLALALGADPTIGYAGPQLLRHAACLGNEEVVQLLLQHGVKLQEVEMEQPLITEVVDKCGELSMVRLLVENGAPLPPLDGSGAPEWDDMSEEMLEYLLLCGLQISQDEHFYVAYSLCARLLALYEGRIQELAEFLKGEKIPLQLRPMMLELAISSNNTPLVRALLQDGVSPGDADVRASNIVHAVCDAEKTDITELVQLLQEAGYSLNEENEIGQTPLEVAFHAAHRDVYRVLVAAGADETALRQKVGEVVYLAQFGTPEEVVAALPAATKEQQRKALRTALDCRRADVAHALVDAGVSLSRVKPSSAAFDTVLLRRVLHGAADKPPGWHCDIANAFLRADKEAYPMLLEAYGDINAKLSDDELFDDSLLKSALMNNNAELVRFLLKNGASIVPEAVFNCYSAECLEALLEAGMDINIRNKMGETLLMYAVSVDDDADFAAALLKRGVDINARNKDGNTALHSAVYRNELVFFQILLKAGADASIRNAEGQTAEELAIEYARGRVLRVLREHRK